RIEAYLHQARLLERPSPSHEEPGVIEIENVPSPAELQQQIKAALSAVLRIDPSIIDADQPFSEFGLDSFLGAALVVAINRQYGTDISHLRVFDYATVREFAHFLGQEIQKRPRPAKKQAIAAAAAEANDRIAIIGMSGRYPKADDLNQYWQNLATGLNAIEE